MNHASEDFFREYAPLYFEALDILEVKYEVDSKHHSFKIDRDSIVAVFPYMDEHKLFGLFYYEIYYYVLERFQLAKFDDDNYILTVPVYNEDLERHF